MQIYSHATCSNAHTHTTYCTTRTYHLFPREKKEFTKGTYHGRRVKFTSKTTCDHMIVGEEAYLLPRGEVCVRPLHHFIRRVLNTPDVDGDVKPKIAA